MYEQHQPRERSGCGCGCVVAALVVIAIAVAVAGFLGLFDRAAYLLHLKNVHTIAATAVQEAPGLDVGYAFAQLDDADREKYLVLLDSFQSREARTYPETDLDDLSRIRDCVLADHPELFYVNGVQVQTTTQGIGLVTNVTVEGQYSYGDDEIAALQGGIDAAVAECLAALPAGADDYQKARHAYEFLARTVDYDSAAAADMDALSGTAGQTIADALVGRRSLCAGYARSFQYLMQQVGIPCTYVTGTARGGSHAWCEAYLDGNWYAIDPTWGDPQFLGEDGPSAMEGHVNYDYLCVTDRDIATTHVTDVPYPLPDCISMTDNYYVREGLYLFEPDVNQAGAIITDAFSRGDSQARFRCDTADVYDRIVHALFDDQQIYRFIPGDSCSYILGDDLHTVVVFL